jgi:hypothetical protein
MSESTGSGESGLNGLQLGTFPSFGGGSSAPVMVQDSQSTSKDATGSQGPNEIASPASPEIASPASPEEAPSSPLFERMSHNLDDLASSPVERELPEQAIDKLRGSLDVPVTDDAENRRRVVVQLTDSQPIGDEVATQLVDNLPKVLPKIPTFGKVTASMKIVPAEPATQQSQEDVVDPETPQNVRIRSQQNIMLSQGTPPQSQEVIPATPSQEEKPGQVVVHSDDDKVITSDYEEEVVKQRNNAILIEQTERAQRQPTAKEHGATSPIARRHTKTDNTSPRRWTSSNAPSSSPGLVPATPIDSSPFVPESSPRLTPGTAIRQATKRARQFLLEDSEDDEDEPENDDALRATENKGLQPKSERPPRRKSAKLHIKDDSDASFSEMDEQDDTWRGSQEEDSSQLPADANIVTDKSNGRFDSRTPILEPIKSVRASTEASRTGLGEKLDFHPTKDQSEDNKANGVWVLWKPHSQWYAARLLGEITVDQLFPSPVVGVDKLTVMYRDGAISETTLAYIRELELEVGDKVKLEDEKKVVYEVVELVNKLGSGERLAARNGYDHVKVKQINSSKERQVPLDLLYMTTGQITAYQNRRQGRDTDMVGVPLRRAKTESVVSTHSTPKKDQVKIQKEIIAYNGSGIFEGCVFTISAMEGDDAKYWKSLICGNGGLILENGLRDLFELDFDSLEMKWIGDDLLSSKLKFGGVLAKTCVRTSKYLEGLALGWPCLSYRFIEDSMEEGVMLPNWENYVLAAGLSEVLDKSPCSFDISGFRQRWQDGACLKDQYERRKLIFGPISADHVYFLKRDHRENVLFLLMATFPRGKLVPVGSVNDVPMGSIVVDLVPKAESIYSCNDRSTRHTMMLMTKHKVLPLTLMYSREWIIQSIINQRIV